MKRTGADPQESAFPQQRVNTTVPVERVIGSQRIPLPSSVPVFEQAIQPENMASGLHYQPMPGYS